METGIEVDWADESLVCARCRAESDVERAEAERWGYWADGRGGWVLYCRPCSPAARQRARASG